MTGRLESINRSRGGVPKTSVFEALITRHGLGGDHQQDTCDHGGPNRAVVLFSLDVILALHREGHPIAAGTVGENLTISGIEWSAVRPGSALRIADVQLVVTEYTAPCERIRHSFLEGDFTRISQKLHPGWSRVSARVVVGGIVRPGDAVSHT
jgi:MOSC domain-containing protein YiiM